MLQYRPRALHAISVHVRAAMPVGLFCRTIIIIIIIIIPLFTLGSIYSTNASGAKQMPETELNRIKNPNWPEVNQLAIQAWPRIGTRTTVNKSSNSNGQSGT